MKIRPAHIALAYFLAGGLLFSQIGVGFFHNRHDAHEKPIELKAGQQALQKHGEHCKVCAVDLLHHLLVHSQDAIHVCAVDSEALDFREIQSSSAPVSLTHGRAPPFFS